ncbi:gamma-glutamylcyclotransferase [Burkholderiaceae bacterium FT117]|uniref:gamma-glutamylcyclotransferase family protein n=1 Tax=Zeimonas sediminis TaxID=2944268 RepID=UPI002342C59A|nr:gamma-glutamylcyclotransferase family protein [Zeimonas sediminis]MCM5569714.1 gamma-glutamylcyclotransferase [Zeimonas sediminis]
MTDLVFVYGTLKQGFPNFRVNRGTRVAGEFVTLRPYPLYVVGDIRVPWLVDRPGSGHPVAGELYRVDAQALALMDELEQIDEPGWYSRREIEVGPRGAAGGETATAFVYFGCADRLESIAVHLGPIAEYTEDLARSYRDGDF